MRASTTSQESRASTVGLDLGDRTSAVCILSKAGEVLETGVVRTTREALELRFKSADPVRIVLEAGPQSPWTSRLLESLGHDVIVANPHRVRLIAESRRKDDRTDAETLARLGRVDPSLLAPITHRSERCQQDLSLLRSRDALPSSRTHLISHSRGVVKAATGERLPACGSTVFHSKALASVPEALVGGLGPVMAAIGTLTQCVRGIDRQVDRLIAERYPEALLLQQVGGVGPLTSLAFVLTLGDPARFTSSRAVGAYCGLTPGRRQSGSRDPQLRITKAGDGYLRRLLVQSAHYILGHFGPDCDLRRWGLAHAASGGKNGKRRAVVAVARKLAVLLHRLWLTGEVYRPLRDEPAA